MVRHGVAACLALLLAGAPAPAQEPPRPPEQGPLLFDIGDADQWTEGDVDILFFSKRVVVARGDFAISADRAMAWKKKGSTRSFDELYADGNVILRQGAQTLRADRLYFDFVKNRAVILDMRARGENVKLKQHFFVSAREARMTVQGRLEADDVSLTTCSYGVPHYHVGVKRAALVGSDPRPAKNDMDLFPFTDWSFEAEEISPEVGMPVFFLPALVLGPWVKDFPLRSLQYGRSSRFGHFVLSEFGMRIKKEDEHGRPRSWGEVIGEADWRENRGGAYGLDLEYDWNGIYSGFIDTYFLHDLGRELDVEFETKFPPLHREERGRARFFHRHELDDHWRFELEASYVSDRSLLEEFFEKEFKEGKEPESAAYLRWLDGNSAAYILERPRLNDFQTQNEYLPRVHAALLQQPVAEGLFDNLLLTKRLDVVHIRRRFDEELHLRSERIWRSDWTSEISLPVDLTLVQVAPFVQHRTTLFEDDLEGETEFRALWTGGGRLTAVVHGTHPDIAWEFLGLRGLRHVAELEVRYANTVDSNLERSDLFPFDEVEELGEYEEAAFEVRNRFMTRDADGTRFEFLNVGAAINYYPDPERDTLSPGANAYLPPFHWIPLTPELPAGTFERRLWSNVYWDASLTPRSFMRLEGRGGYNPDSGHEEIRELTVSVEPMAGLNASLSRMFIRGITDAYGVGASWKVTEKWSVAAAGQYDFKADEYVSQSLTVSRHFHDFVVEGVLERDFGRDERRFYVAVVPTFAGRRRPAR